MWHDVAVLVLTFAIVAVFTIGSGCLLQQICGDREGDNDAKE